MRDEGNKPQGLYSPGYEEPTTDPVLMAATIAPGHPARKGQLIITLEPEYLTTENTLIAILQSAANIGSA
jgi:hypothetical protein